jgi:hypothetical protein
MHPLPPSPMCAPLPAHSPRTRLPGVRYRHGKEVGRHVGSSRGDLIGRILEVQAAYGVQPPPPPPGAGRSRKHTGSSR